MPEQLKPEEVNAKIDSSISKQYDRETPMADQIKEFYEYVDSERIGLLTTNRPNVGPVSRSMGIAKRDGPDFYFLANKNSHKFQDIASNKTAQITFQNSSSQNWASITGEITLAGRDDALVKELYNPIVSAWFGDLGDGVHNGRPEDPRYHVILLKPKYISYWKSTVGTLGFMKEVGGAAATGTVAKNGVQREFNSEVIQGMRVTSKRGACAITEIQIKKLWTHWRKAPVPHKLLNEHAASAFLLGPCRQLTT
ncbi:MAG: hypothetical protein Q9162_001899 [Coniocarpon cinnabarinum]